MSADVSVPVAASADEEEWRRLSPRMLLVHPVKEVGRAVPALVAVFFAGSGSGHRDLWGLGGAAIVIVLSVVRWVTTRYRVGADQLQIREGVLRRRTLSARLDRVRTVDVTSHALHRALGLARVEIGTGVSDRKGQSNLKLDGLPAAAAARLRGELLHRSRAQSGPPSGGTAIQGPAWSGSAADGTAIGGPASGGEAGGVAPYASGTAGTAMGGVTDGRFSGAPEDGRGPGRTDGARIPYAGSYAHTGALPAELETEVEIARLRPEWIRFAPFTLSGAFTGLAIAGFVWRMVSEGDVHLESFGPLRDLVNQLDRVSIGVAVAEVLLAGIVFIGLASTARYVLAYWNFRLTRHSGGSFQVTRGLFTTRATSIEVRRLRGVGISEPLLLRLIGGGRTVAIATGLETGRGASPSGRGGTVLLPDAPLAEAQRVAGAVTGQPGLAAAALRSNGPAARRRRYTRAVGGAVALPVVVGAGWRLLGLAGWDWLAVGIVLLIAVPLAGDRARNLGHLVQDGFLVVQSGSLVRRRAIIETDSIIGWNVRQSLFQRRAGVATLVATTAAGRQSYRVVDLSLAGARAVADGCRPGLLDEFASRLR